MKQKDIGDISVDLMDVAVIGAVVGLVVAIIAVVGLGIGHIWGDIGLVIIVVGLGIGVISLVVAVRRLDHLGTSNGTTSDDGRNDNGRQLTMD